MAIQIVEEEIVDGFTAYVTAGIAAVIATVNSEATDGLVLAAFPAIDKKYVDPLTREDFPNACVWVGESEDSERNRALDRNVSSLRFMMAVRIDDALLHAYRYLAALKYLLQQDRTCANTINNVRMVRRRYYTSLSSHDEEVTVFEAFIQATQEVRKS